MSMTMWSLMLKASTAGKQLNFVQSLTEEGWRQLICCMPL